MFSKWDCEVRSLEGGMGSLHKPLWAEETSWCGPTEVQGSEVWVASNHKTLSKIVQSVFHPSYGLLILTISHHTFVMAYTVKSCADCSQPHLCLSYAWKFLPWATDKFKCYKETIWSVCLLTELRQRSDLLTWLKQKIIYWNKPIQTPHFPCASNLVWGQLCHRIPNPMFVLAGKVNALCLMYKDAEFGLLQILNQNKKYVYCSTSCPPFFRM